MSEDMKPGHELDAAVAVKVMGWFRPPKNLGVIETIYNDGGGMLVDLQKHQFSTDWRAAGEVLPHLVNPWLCRDGGIWTVHCRGADGGAVHVRSESLPHAICLAALAACEGEGR